VKYVEPCWVLLQEDTAFGVWTDFSYLFLFVQNCTAISLSQRAKNRNIFHTRSLWWLSNDILSQENKHWKGADKDAHNFRVESENFITTAPFRVIIFTYRRMAAKHKTGQPQDTRKAQNCSGSILYCKKGLINSP